MTEALDFNDLKNAFARKAKSAAVRSLSQPMSHSTHSTLELELAELSAELRRTRADLAESHQKLAFSESEHKKALQFIRTLTEEKLASDTAFARFHEDKMRLHRTLNKKASELETLSKRINQDDLQMRSLKQKLAHIQNDLKKLQKKNATSAEKMAELQAINAVLKLENQQLKKMRTPLQMIKKWVLEQGGVLKTKSTKLVRSLTRRKRTETTALTWIPTKNALPKRQCLVFVRNEKESDIAVYYPQTKAFKCAKKQFRVTEWAFSK